MSVGTMKPSRRDDLQSYHGRVASALRIDRIRRVLEFTCIRSTTPESPIRAMPLLADLEHSSWDQGADDDDLRGPPAQGGKCILAIGRSDGTLVLKSTYDALPRFQVQQPFPVSCVSWRPITTLRPSRNPFNPGIAVQSEDLIIGDDTGVVYYYAVEWPMGWEVTRDTWPGTIYLIAKVSLHTQQVCGLSWSPNGKLFATGGNDNLCCLFDADSVLAEKQEPVRHKPHWPGWHLATGSTQGGLPSETRGSVPPGCLPKHDDAAN
ncbi:hypothetical protein A9Z42_0052010 [Trichoderma parareesei]|uniref:Uncharacterized protein n=1 Tax=Trichoderma parareesei TaxID=858221 RepID=A0A2H2ZBU1_TRIPA|nr:hypothetical protein A9Z42_0052010 [Trichoderma parareesei]